MTMTFKSFKRLFKQIFCWHDFKLHRHIYESGNPYPAGAVLRCYKCGAEISEMFVLAGTTGHG